MTEDDFTRLIGLVHALAAVIRAEAASTDDVELRLLLEASSTAVEHEKHALSLLARDLVEAKTRDLERRLALFSKRDGDCPARADTFLTDFLVNDCASRSEEVSMSSARTNDGR